MSSTPNAAGGSQAPAGSTTVRPIPPSAKPAGGKQPSAPAQVKPPAAAGPDDSGPSDDELRAANRKMASDLLRLDAKSVLPGVAPDLDGLPGVTAISSKADQRAEFEAAMDGGDEGGKQAKGAAPERDPVTGKFKPKAGDASVDGDQPPADVAPASDEGEDTKGEVHDPEPGADDDPDNPGFVFNKRKFKDISHAEQVFETIRGRAQTAEKYRVEREQFLKDREDAIALVNQWKAYAENLAKGMKPADAAGSAAADPIDKKTVAGAPPAPAPSKSSVTAGLASLSPAERKVAKDVLRNPSAYGYESPEDALFDLAEVIADRVANARVGQTDSKLEAISKPIEESRKSHEELQTAKQLWGKFADHEVDGQPAFPELTNDPAFRDRVLQFWQDHGKQMDEHAIYYAILRVRDEFARRPSAKPSETVNLDDLLPPEIEDTVRTPVMGSATDAPRSLAPRRGGDSDDIKRLKESILKAGINNSSGLPGVAR